MELKLKEIRQQYGIKQANISEYLNTSQALYSRYETGKIEPSLETLCKIADYYKLPLDALVGRIPPQTELNYEISKLTQDQKKKLVNIIKATFEEEQKKED